MIARLLLTLWLALSCAACGADQIRVAVASNFAAVGKQLAADFQQRSGHRVRLAFGSTGKHYAQIVNGAPFELFLAADRERPERLEREQLAIAGSRFTYAIGHLVLWGGGDDEVSIAALSSERVRRLAIANPKLAPYGRAAQQLLQHRGLWQSLQPKLVYGENIGQALQFARSGNAQLGLLALSQVQGLDGSYWRVPEAEYQPIVQQAIQLRASTAATEFLAYLHSPAARQIIIRAGYSVPDHNDKCP